MIEGCPSFCATHTGRQGRTMITIFGEPRSYGEWCDSDRVVGDSSVGAELCSHENPKVDGKTK